MNNYPEKMMAVVAYGPGDYRYESVSTPVPRGKEILIKVEGCGICGSDVKCNHGAEVYWGKDGKPGFVEGPVIPGHEFVGRVIALGPEALTKGEFKTGDRVVSEVIAPCGECRFCKSGSYNMCVQGQIYGFKKTINGAFAEYMIFPEKAIIHKISDTLPVEKAVLIEPFSCASHGISHAKITGDDVVVISGLGTIGLGMIGAAKKYKPKKLIGLEMNPLRMDLGKKFGCDMVLNPKEVDVVARVRELTDGYGCDVYVEVAAHPSSVIQGLNMIRNQGRFVEFSIFGDPVTCDWTIISDMKELTIYGSHLAPNSYQGVIEGITSGSTCTDGVVTHTYPLSEFNEALKKAEQTQGVIKVALIP
jgi:threonine dehydrogenase-like Zn-dependent dehydrogenase